MKFLGLDFSRNKDDSEKKELSPVGWRGPWYSVWESFAGAWQRNEEWTVDTVLASQAVYACISLISTDIGKLPFSIVRRTRDGIWVRAYDERLMRLLKRPNRYQNHIQFKEWWITSKLVRGNTYVLKERNNTGEVVALYVLDPSRVQVLVADDGSIYYELNQDRLNGQQEDTITVPASEIIHDRMNCLFNPLVGVSPLYASGLAASQGLKIQQDSSKFFSNGANPSGILTAPGSISDDTAARMKAHWESNYTGDNAGRVAVLGDGLKFEAMRMTAVDAQLIEQLRWTGEVVCSTFHVPAYKVGVGDMPTYNNIEAQTKDYYSQCLQTHIESMELCLDEGLGVEDRKAIELDLDVLFRMDSKTKIETLGIGVENKLYTINDGRRHLNLPPIEGGDTVYMQQQDYSLQAIYERDQNAPLLTQPEEPAAVPEEVVEDEARALAAFFTKEMQDANNA